LLVRLQLRGAVGQYHVVEVVVDTGFTGALALPPSDVAALGLPLRLRTDVVLAGGAKGECDVYAGTVVWDGVARAVLIQSMDGTPLVGMALLAGHDLRARVVPGGRVEIEAIS
jgi:predicted aspartyl protease